MTSSQAPALRFSLFGFPVRVEGSFLLVLGLFGMGLPGAHIVIWVLVAALSVLGHELGHAFASRSVGAKASITLEGLGGLTRSSRTEPLTRRESALVSAAGPAAGLLLGLLAFVAIGQLGWESWTTGGWVLRLAVFTTAGWSLFNLLPVLPLDGGHLLEVGLPGSPEERRRKAARVSIVVAGAGALFAYRAGMPFAALFAVMLAGQNLSEVKQHAQTGPLDDLERRYQAGNFAEMVEPAREVANKENIPPSGRLAARRYAVLALVYAGRGAEALDELDGSPEREQLGPGFRGYVLATSGDVDAGVVLAARAFGDDPTTDNAVWVLHALLAGGRYHEAAVFVEKHHGVTPFALVERAWAGAFGAADYASAARIGDAGTLPPHRHPGEPGPAQATLAYNAACSWARAGAPDRALASLRSAFRLGWTDMDQVDIDEDLSTLRQRPDWPALRAGYGLGADRRASP